MGVQVKGLADLRRGLRKLDRGLDTQIGTRIRGPMTAAAQLARANLRARSKNPRGRIEPTIRPFVRQKAAGIQSSHPGAPVQEWGGTIEPRGTPIRIEGKQYATDAAEATLGTAAREIDDLIDDLGRQADFH